MTNWSVNQISIRLMDKFSQDIPKNKIFYDSDASLITKKALFLQ